VVVGTAAVADPPLVGRLAARHPGGVAVGLDARDGEVAVRGWTAGSGASVLDLVARFAGDGVGAFVVTDIGRDGTLSGPDVRGLAAVLAATDVPVVASGGVGSLDDLRARQAKSLDTRVARLRATATTGPTRERGLRLRLPPPPHAGRVVLEVEGLAKGYGGPPVFEDITFDVGRGERLLVLGLNGAGKTSLLRILAGTSTADAGIVREGLGVSVGYYAQEHEGVLAGRDVLSHVAEAGPPERAVREQRGLLGMFGLTGDKAEQDAGTLSGGEKTRLALAVLVAGRHNLLLLDEPTNNLDPPSRTAAADALAGWGGAMVIVSHDPEFVQALRPDRVLLMPDGDVDAWSDDVLDLVALA
jgi:ATPase subunit of ABC transporter with duplicated ATPase domains